MTFAILIFLACALAVLGALSLAGTPAEDPKGQAPAQRSIWTVTLATPSLLVPTLIAAVVAWFFLEVHGWHHWVSENPFGLRGQRYPQEYIPVLIVMSMLVAGYVGLLSAYHRLGKADGGHFWAGIKNHTFTFLFAKAAICGWAALLSEGLRIREEGMVMLYLAPSLLFAPLLGTAALHPRRPLRALKAAIDRTWDLGTTSRLILFQALAFLLVWAAFSGFAQGDFRLTSGLHSIGRLVQESSVLSFNPLPMLRIAGLDYHEPFAGVLCAGIAMFLSTVFMHAHFRRVMQRPDK